MAENSYIQIVQNFLRNNPKLYQTSTPEEKLKIAQNLAEQISAQVAWATPKIAEAEIARRGNQINPKGDEIGPNKRQAITNMARVVAEERALHDVLYEMI